MNILPALVYFLVQLFVAVLYSVRLAQRNENSRENSGRKLLEKHLRATDAVTDAGEQQGRPAYYCLLSRHVLKQITQKVTFLQESFPTPL